MGGSERVFRSSGDAVSSRMGDELALLDFRTNTYFTLNETGATVWEFLTESRSVGAICEHVARVYEIETADCAEDIARLLTSLEEAGLVDASDSPTRS